jgi:hypothetical protein
MSGVRRAVRPLHLVFLAFGLPRTANAGASQPAGDPGSDIATKQGITIGGQLADWGTLVTRVDDQLIVSAAEHQQRRFNANRRRSCAH